MAKKKSGKTIKSINFEDVVLQELEHKCKKEGIALSTFVNELVKRAIMTDPAFYLELARIHCAEMNKYKGLADYFNEDKVITISNR